MVVLVVSSLSTLALGSSLALHAGTASALAASTTDGTSTTPAATSPSAEPVDIESLLAQRAAQLQRRSQAVDARVAALDALKAQQLLELGYDPETASTPQEIARQMMLTWYAWDEDQYACYDSIIMRESRWDPFADNPHSSAYGIPQALPGKKMASAGDDWKTNPATQIKWGLGYVKERYGTPCKAWSFKRSHGWY